jgi:protein phosphatase PTC7
VVLGSDGLFDNLFDEDLVQCIGAPDMEPHSIATCLAQRAHALSLDKSYDSPFAKNARAAGRSHPGGKKDDITVVVSRVNLANQ